MRKIKQRTSLFRIILTTIVLFFVLESIVFIYTFYVENRTKKDVLSQSNKMFTLHMQFATNYLHDVSNVFYETKIQHNAQIANIIDAANKTTDKQERKRLRKQLYTLCIDTYKIMKRHQVRQFHFHLLNSISFLRFHKPEVYGDSLLGVRPSLEEVIKTQKPLYCFEEGRIFNGFRNVYPVFKGKKIVGTVEISYAYNALQDKISYVDNSFSFLLMRSDIVASKVFFKEQYHYKESEFNGFLYDTSTLKETKTFPLKKLHTINSHIGAKVQEQLQKAQQFSIEVENTFLNYKHTMIADFIPLYNIEHKNVAYVVRYSKSELLEMLEKDVIRFFLLLSLAVLLVSFIIFGLLYVQARREREIYELATHDPLTKIYNRKGLLDILKQKIGEVKRYKRELSVIFFDIDHFKQINDKYGHVVGDKVLQELSKTVSENIRKSDIFARWGGEEFLILLPETSKEQAVVLAEKLRETIADQKFEKVQKVTCSFGVTELQKNDSLEDLLKRVDKLLYKAKSLGRNIVIDR